MVAFALRNRCQARCATHHSQLVQLVALVGRNGQRYRLARVCRLFVGGYGAVLGRLDGNGVVYCLECCLHFQIAGGHDKGVFAVGGYCYSHLGFTIHYSQLV